MKKFLKVPLYFFLFIALIISIGSIIKDWKNLSNLIKDAKESIGEAKKCFEKIEADGKITAILANREWYVINETTVSSEKNDSGIVVTLPEPLSSKESQSGIICPKKNVKVLFVPRGIELYKMGEFLTYYYQNEEKSIPGQ